MGFFDALNAGAGAYFQGQKLIAELDDQKAQTEQRKAQTEGLAIQNQVARIGMDNKKALSDWMRANATEQAGQAATATDLAKQFTNATKFAADRGDFDGAKEMGALASTQIVEAGRQQTQLEKQVQSDREALSTAAQNVQENPTQENHEALFKSALKAGVNPLDIPAINSPRYDAFLKTSALSAMSGSKRLEYQEKQREFEERQRAQKEERAARHAEREAQRADTAAYREASLAVRKDLVDIRRNLADKALAKPDPNSKLSATMERQAVAVVNAANEAGQSLSRMSKMDFGDTASAFSHLEDPKTVLKALTSTGTNKLAPEKIQMLQANLQLLGLEVAQAMAAPYKPNKEQISEARKMVEPVPGDTEYTAMYKMALAASVMKTRLEAIPKTEALKEARGHAEANFAKFPSPDEIYEHAKARGVKLKLRREGATFMDKLKTMMPGGGEEAPAAAHPPEIQSLLDQYAPRKP